MVSDVYPLFHSRANPVDEVIPIDSSVESLIDVDSGVSVVDSDFLDREVISTSQRFPSVYSLTAADQNRDPGTPSQARGRSSWKSCQKGEGNPKETEEGR